MLFVIDNPNNFQTNSEVNVQHKRSENQISIQNTNLTSVKKNYLI